MSAASRPTCGSERVSLLPILTARAGRRLRPLTAGRPVSGWWAPVHGTRVSVVGGGGSVVPGASGAIVAGVAVSGAAVSSAAGSGVAVGDGASAAGASVGAGAAVSGAAVEGVAVVGGGGVVGGKEVSVLLQEAARSAVASSTGILVDQGRCLMGSEFSEGVDA